MKNEIDRVLFSKEAIALKVKEIGLQITEEYQDEKNLVVVGILKGANIFLSDLIREIDIPLYIDFMAVSSYGNSTESSGVVRILKDIEIDLTGKHVLIVEDIVDTGLTLEYLTSNILSRNVASLKVCTLLDKPAKRKSKVKIDYIGFDIPDEFVVGYGIDYAEKYRNLPYIGVLKEEVYK
ncbi:MAG: hypoxanthine phosphoribosyltransferase [Alkaliphilus sp.]|nr:MAG: hypoxanthine phosphoribosyltransferase [Alkaliphilus sp.]